MYVESGSPVALRCVISHWLTKPRVVFWYRNGIRLISGVRGLSTHEEQRVGRTIVRGGGEAGDGGGGGGSREYPSASASIVSQLTIDKAHPKLHSGHYKCAPDNIQPAVVNLHVIRGEFFLVRYFLQQVITSRVIQKKPFRF